MITSTQRLRRPVAAATLSGCLLLAGCGSGDADTAADTGGTSTSETTDGSASSEAADTTTDGPTTSEATETADQSAVDETTSGAAATTSCDETAALFVTRGSANPDLVDPEVAATCDGTTITVVSNGVPDYTYIGTSPGEPDGREFTFTMPAEPTMAETVTDVPYIGPIGMTLNGISIYGPTEGTGGDVDSLPGIISECGSHNGPGGFHTHKILASDVTDCFFTPEEVAAAPQLAGYASDGFPIYTGVDQYTSSWQLTDDSLFASDTWAAHTYVEGSGDLDQCNGRYDEDGNYAYYTTATFPYVLGCFAGEVELETPGGDEGDRPERPDGDDGDRPARPDDEDDEERPARPDEDAGGDA